MKKWFAVLAALAFLLVIPSQEAEAQVSFGPQVVLWDFDEVGVGARVDIGLGESLGIEDGAFADLFASIDGNYLFGAGGMGDESGIMIGANANVPFQIDAAVTPYAGAGLNYHRVSANDVSFSNSGLNLLGGIFFGLGEIPAFAQVQYSTTWTGFLSLSAGVLFGG